MTSFEIFLVVGFTYVVADFLFGIFLGRCVLPGLKCKACRK